MDSETPNTTERRTVRQLEQARTARLLFDAELQSATIDIEALANETVERATAVRPVAPRPVRLVQQIRYKLGRLDYEQAVAEPLLEARREALGAASEAPPRFLIRVDEFPHYMADDRPGRFATEHFERFHEIMSAAGAPYLIAVLPRVSREPLSPAARGSRGLSDKEREVLSRIARERVTLAMHGLDHRTRFDSPRRHSELCGLGAEQLDALLEQGLSELGTSGIHPQVFVPPYNRFDAEQYAALARRFAVVCGGPESIGTMGFHSTPQWRGEAVYLPSYAPLYGHCNEVRPAVQRMIERGGGVWAPVALHWGWEAEEGFAELERLAALIAPYVADWEDFTDAVRRSHAPLQLREGAGGLQPSAGAGG
ncbi:MAG TPA: DUF2334 domain-containing protein [Solirubrobacteraceae bacterium]|nr:DUF2334 domain-containing protein [Solirubrobacteraceae bacterium]